MENEKETLQLILDKLSSFDLRLSGLELGQQKTEADLSNLQLGQQKTEADLSNLQLGQQKTEADLSNLQLGQQKMEADLSNLQLGQQKMEANQQDLKRDLDRKIDRISVKVDNIDNTIRYIFDDIYKLEKRIESK